MLVDGTVGNCFSVIRVRSGLGSTRLSKLLCPRCTVDLDMHVAGYGSMDSSYNRRRVGKHGDSSGG